MIEALTQYEFMRNALWAGLLAAVACGIIGTYVVVKRMTFISGGISHASFGGIGLGYYLSHYISWMTPVIGALIFTMASALGIGMVVNRSRVTEDTAIGIMWSLGMAIGIIFIGITPGYVISDLFGYLFGNILIVPTSDIIMMIVLDAIITGVVILLYKEFFALSFDQEFSTAAGIPTERLYLMLLGLIALTVVLLIRVVGIILVIALLTIPSATARQYTHSMKNMMWLSILIGMASVIGGLRISYELDIASGATIILFSAAIFMISTIFTRLCRRRTHSEAISTD